MKFLIWIAVLLILVLVGCSVQTITKYQCADGSFVDSANSCSSRACQESNCPPQKLAYKYQCFDGSTSDKITDCKEIKSYLNTQKIKHSDEFCAKPENKDYQKISINNYFDPNRRFTNLDKTFLYKYYPSLSEGWIVLYPTYIENSGCTKLEWAKFSVKTSVYLNNKLINSHESKFDGYIFGYSEDEKFVYPEDEKQILLPLVGDEDYNRDGEKLIGGSNERSLKITSAGNYIIRATIFYNSENIGDIEDILEIS